MQENLAGLRRVLKWEKVQLTVSRDKSSFPAWRNITQESGPGSWILSYLLYLPSFPLLPNVPRRCREVCPKCFSMLAMENERVLRWMASHLIKAKKKKRKIHLGGNEVPQKQQGLWSFRWMRLGKSYNLHESHFPHLFVMRNKWNDVCEMPEG